MEAEKTEIARFSQMVVPTLAQRCSLQVIDEKLIDEGEFGVEDIIETPETQNIYHLGNSHMHCGVVDMAMQNPGIVVMHDVCMMELALAYGRKSKRFDVSEMAFQEYGAEAEAALDAMFGGENYEWCGRDQAQYDHFADRFPLFESFVRHALGVVVHSTYALERVKQVYSGPAVRLDLPYLSAECDKLERVHEMPYEIVFCGHAGPNRRLKQFLSAWKKVSEGGAFNLSLVGKIAKVDELQAHVDELGLTQHVQFVGYLSDEELDQRLAAADLAINLRYPTMGEASASQLRLFSQAVPTIVSDVGWYSELPDDVVVKISIEREEEDIRALMEEMIAGDFSRLQCGAAGYHYLKRQHTVDRYVSDMLDFVDRVGDRRFVEDMMGRRVIGVLASMCEDVNDSKLFEPTIASLSSMVDNL